MFDMPPFVLGFAFVLVGALAWYIGRRSAAARTVRLPRDYYVGLEHLINDRIDHAAEVFTRMAAADGDTAEIQFALGSLFRRRGEVDRAIALHTRLRELGPPALRDKAAFALGLDYLSAGLMDRAERLFEELSASREYRDAALEHLLRVYEQQTDWPNALKIFHELPPATQKERRRVAAHYLCELTEQALLQGDLERARVLLRQAGTHDADLSRAAILTARLAEAGGDAHGALEIYLGALEAAPGLALEIIPRLLALASHLGNDQIVEALTQRLQKTGRVSERQLAWLLATALPTLGARKLSELTAPEEEGDVPNPEGRGTAEASPSESRALGALLTRISDSGGRYQCDDCGLNSVGWYWRCPKCRSWDSLRPAVFKWADKA